MTTLPGQRPTLETAFDLIRATIPKLTDEQIQDAVEVMREIHQGMRTKTIVTAVSADVAALCNLLDED